ncbi:histidine phosphatase family protein [Leifsonia sp. WHRI 6310E]|uniref:histidine phosphatase family protein n=1 Tax=Leifsonia sp. WHRI 6310E TaxID=3162562 RepID=UPI0032EC17CD
MNDPRIALVRHGETDWNARNVFQGRVDRPLNENGLRQADGAAVFLSRWRWGRVVSSPLTRAQQTARAIGEWLSLPPDAEPWPDLTERAFGAAEGVDRDRATARWPDEDFPDSEPISAVDERAVRAWHRLESAEAGVIAVTHVVIVRTIVRSVTGIDPGFVGNGSAIVLERRRGSWQLTAVVDPSNENALGHGPRRPATRPAGRRPVRSR